MATEFASLLLILNSNFTRSTPGIKSRMHWTDAGECALKIVREGGGEARVNTASWGWMEIEEAVPERPSLEGRDAAYRGGNLSLCNSLLKVIGGCGIAIDQQGRFRFFSGGEGEYIRRGGLSVGWSSSIAHEHSLLDHCWMLPGSTPVFIFTAHERRQSS